jgi:excisionase family DNA binding protein
VLTVKEVSRRLRVSPSTIYNLVEGGQISCHRIGKGRGSIRFTEAQVEAYLHACEVDAGARRTDSNFTHPQR